MANESERRLKKAMDKLYHFPKPKSSPSSSQVEKSRRAEIGTRFGMERGSRLPTVRTFAGDPPPCRPWDRADLMRRLTTFKAMTWFAKPKVISAVNCARRGWINIEVDIISCEACGARLLFSTPSSWSLQQVEKAASVFSLKLDNGHKLLCPWIDNTCEESLVNFPPTPPEILTNNYRENLSSLSKLFYLPAICSSAIEYMKSRAPQLEDMLLNESFEGVFEGIRVSEELEGFEGLVQDSDSYFQALKLISLCGWEPHQLPYSVDRVNPNASETLTESNLFSKPNETSSTLSIYSQNGDSSNNNNNSFTLQCNFCKARVALWVFKTVERPLRLFKLVTNDDSVINNIDNNDDDNSNNNNNNVGGLNANSIGGGPVPTRSKFRPRVSFPVVSRHLKCDLESFGGLKRKRGDEDVLSECGDAELMVDKQKTNDHGNGNDEFDPIKQHRTFCPWISPEDNPEILPGWKMTFLALLSQQNEKEKEKEKDGEAPLERRSSLLDEEEIDPVVSVRRLFTATPPKKLKLKNTP